MEIPTEQDKSIAESLDYIARSLRNLGNGDASVDESGTAYGAIEYLGKRVCESLEHVAEALWGIADAMKYPDRKD